MLEHNRGPKRKSRTENLIDNLAYILLLRLQSLRLELHRVLCLYDFGTVQSLHKGQLLLKVQMQRGGAVSNDRSVIALLEGRAGGAVKAHVQVHLMFGDVSPRMVRKGRK